LYVAIRRYETDPKSVSEVVRRVREEFVPTVSKVPGFVSYTVLDAGNGTLATISMFQDKSGADESNRRAADFVKTMSSLLPNAPQVTAGEAVIK
jgi:quinol monooxygenase YgiN